MTAPRSVVFPIEVKISVDGPEDTKRRSLSVALPYSSPMKRYDQKTVSTPVLSSDENTWHYHDASLYFANFDLNFLPRV